MTDLSPAAQAVLTAFGKYPLHGDHIANTLMYGALPAALRAVALHLYCEEIVTCGGSSYALVIEQEDILALADELEAQ